tara:strand:- start:5042 stop:5845 length:804 start_codon:yes stop_codon:yes gene_type:complete
MKKTVTIRRKELLGHLPKEVRISAITKLGSIYVGRQPLKGVEGAEEKKFLNGVLDVSPDHVDWPKHVKHYWADLSIKVPFEGVQLEVGTDEDGNPYNVDQYLKYRFAVKHPHVSLTKEDVGGTNRFYIHDENRDILKKNADIQTRKDADKEFIKLSADDQQMSRVLRLMSDINPDTLTREQQENTLYALKESSPKKFIRITKDKNLSLKAEVEELVSAGVLRKIGNQIIYIDDVLGETIEDTIVYLKDKKNSGTLTVLRAKLKEAVV